VYEAARKFSQSIAAGSVNVKHSNEELSLDSHAF